MNKEFNNFLTQQAIRTIKGYPFKYDIEEKYINYNASEMIVTLSNLVKTTMDNELRGYFTEKEAMSLCDAMRGVMISSYYSVKDQILNNVLDAIEYENYDSKWKVDGRALYEKLDKLSEFQTYCITCMTNEFWKENCNKSIKETLLIE